MTMKVVARVILRVIMGIYAVGALVALVPVPCWVAKWLWSQYPQDEGGVLDFMGSLSGMMLTGMPALFFFMSSIYALHFALHGDVRDLNDWAEERYRKG